MRYSLAVLFALATFTGRAELVSLTNDAATCVVDTCGGWVRSCCIKGREILWSPSTAVPPGEAWRHGGIPIAWPWFGRIGNGDENIHGYAWRSSFAVKERASDRVVLVLRTEAALLEYTVALGTSLDLQLRTINLSQYDLPVGAAFHPYFRVGERDDAVVEGVESVPIPVTNAVDRAVRFGKVETKRTYLLCDKTEQRTLRITAFGSTGVNVWNPGVEKKCPGTIPGDEWRHFVAVEPFVMGSNRFLVLKPNEDFVLQMSVVAE